MKYIDNNGLARDDGETSVRVVTAYCGVPVAEHAGGSIVLTMDPTFSNRQPASIPQCHGYIATSQVRWCIGFLLGSRESNTKSWS